MSDDHAADHANDQPAPTDEVARDVEAAPPQTGNELDLDAIARELAAVEHALPRLDDGSYWIDEVTGDPIPDAVLAADPVARRG